MSSGLPLKADVTRCRRHVSKVPIPNLCTAAISCWLSAYDRDDPQMRGICVPLGALRRRTSACSRPYRLTILFEFVALRFREIGVEARRIIADKGIPNRLGTDLQGQFVIAPDGGVRIGRVRSRGLRRRGGQERYLLATFFTPAFVTALRLPSSSNALRTCLNSCSEASSARGNRRFSASSVLTIVEPITTRANHL